MGNEECLEQRIVELYDRHGDELKSFMDQLKVHYPDFCRRDEHNAWVGPQSNEMENEINWLMIRDLKPEVVIELGSCSGWSTIFLIDAVARNRAFDDKPGKVISYDFLDVSKRNIANAYPLDGDNTGIWTLVVGDARVAWPKTASLRDGKIGYVWIDCDHSADFAEWYITTILDTLDPGTGVAIHDIANSLTGECPSEQIRAGSRFDIDGTFARDREDNLEGATIVDYLEGQGISFVNPNPHPENDSSGKIIGLHRMEKTELPHIHDRSRVGHGARPWNTSAIFYVKNERKI
jgi:predicted O-methyltransferase YrrM